MSCKVVVPKPARDEIASWGLPRSVLLEVYNRLLIELAADPDSVTQRLAAPSPTFVFQFILDDPEEEGFAFDFVFYLTYGPGEGRVLVVRQSFFERFRPEDDEQE